MIGAGLSAAPARCRRITPKTRSAARTAAAQGAASRSEAHARSTGIWGVWACATPAGGATGFACGGRTGCGTPTPPGVTLRRRWPTWWLARRPRAEGRPAGRDSARRTAEERCAAACGSTNEAACAARLRWRTSLATERAYAGAGSAEGTRATGARAGRALGRSSTATADAIGAASPAEARGCAAGAGRPAADATTAGTAAAATGMAAGDASATGAATDGLAAVPGDVTDVAGRETVIGAAVAASGARGVSPATAAPGSVGAVSSAGPAGAGTVGAAPGRAGRNAAGSR
jgi:hypothetical protein